MRENSVHSLIPMELPARVANDSRNINPANSIVWINRSFRQITQEDNNIDYTLYIAKLIEISL